MRLSTRHVAFVYLVLIGIGLSQARGQVSSSSGEVQIGGSGLREGFPRAAVSNAGDALVVWERLTVDGYSVIGQVVDNSGNLVGIEQLICGPTSGFPCQRPAVALSSDGLLQVVVVEGADSSGGGVFASLGEAGAWSVPVQVNEATSGLQASPVVAIDNQGETFLVVWVCFDRGLIVARRFASDGSALGPEILVGDEDDSFVADPRIAINDSGDYAIVWSTYGQDDFGSGIAVRLFGDSDDPIGDVFQPYDAGIEHECSPAVGSDATGNVLVAWSQRSIWRQWLDSTGARLGTARELSSAGASLTDPGLAVTSGGGSVIAWTELPTYDLRLSAFAKDGVSIAEAVAINTGASTRGERVQIAINDGGNLVAVWQGSPAGGEIWARRFQVGFPGTLTMCKTVSQVEEDCSQVVATVCRNGDTSAAASVQYQTADGTANAGFDYQSASGSLFWAADEAAVKSFSVDILDDTEAEGDELFSITLHSPVSASLGDSGETAVQITDNDLSTVRLATDAVFSLESTGFAETSVIRTGPAAYPLTVSWVLTDGTATYPEDYTVTGGTCSWSAGDTGDCIVTVPFASGAQETEEHETFTLSLDEASPAAILDTPTSATVTIIEDYPSVLVLQETSLTVDEGCGFTTVSVERMGSLGGEVTVDVITRGGSGDGGAAEGADYAPITETLIWEDKEGGSKTATIQILNDNLVESTETFVAQLSDLTGMTSIGPPGLVVITILDNDEQEVPGERAWINEDAWAVNVQVARSDVQLDDGRPAGYTDQYHLSYSTVDGSARAGADYEATSGELSWGPGETSPQTITVRVTDDNELEADESFFIQLQGDNEDTDHYIPVTILGNDWVDFQIDEDGRFLKLASDKLGNSVLVWQYNHRVYAQHFHQSDRRRGGELLVDEVWNADGLGGNDVAMNGDGEFIVVWSTEYNCGLAKPCYMPVGRMFDWQANPLAVEFKACTSTGMQSLPWPSVAISDSGDALVAWQENGDLKVYGRVVSNNGYTVGSQFRLSDSGVEESYPDVCADYNDGFIVVWCDRDMIYGRKFDTWGVPISQVFEVCSSLNGGDLPKVATNGDGRIIVVWRRTGNGVYARQFRADLEPIGPEFLVRSSIDAGSSAYAPAVTMSDQGYAVVAWASIVYQYYDRRVYGCYLDGNGSFVGNSYFFIDSPPERRLFYPAITALPSGGFFAVWLDDSLGISGAIKPSGVIVQESSSRKRGVRRIGH